MEHSNFPIFNDYLNFNEEEMFSYLKLFPHHDIHFYKTSATLSRTLHRYEDGLSFLVNWKSLEPVSHPTSELVNMREILNLFESGRIALHSVHLRSFSHYANVASDEALLLFKNAFSEKITAYLEQHYHELEHNLRLNYSTDDDEFSALIRSVQNYIDFENYLNKNKKEPD